ncbi:hypothetical protein A7D00_3015 [Trichophyton violaceum]|uniref:Uncharacterized protein n=1 Tax=Trichophyton violaceum TaxID=34388 RepID=A0A178FL64_TRIVO|nr:hypothetical protein A7D00_3015 [Trichophyton violaceum]
MPSARRKTPASELAKAISQSKQSPNVHLPPPKSSLTVRTQEELGRMGVRGAPKQPDIKQTPQYKSAARRCADMPVYTARDIANFGSFPSLGGP